jgi:hypothetical protein
MKKDTNKFLLELGVKEKLLSKLKDSLISQLASYAMDHVKAPNIAQLVTLIAFMELNGKKGAAELAAEGIVTPEQLKSLEAHQISQILGDFYINHDINIAIKNVRKYVIANQQEKLYLQSGGLKGEYHLYKDHGDLDEDVL